MGALLTATTGSGNNDNPVSHELGKWPSCSGNDFFLLLFQKDKSLKALHVFVPFQSVISE